ncbi:tripartite tricarboxylate transporter permease [Petroclostridium sp. X23]|uniref:tripartite tricarboxylate transporter permease n=1 Tax=Petroclostridium sp. X23 TaxID=3045146 RepID=UPI0024AE7EF3|nr:tripartite tricarboxylate transporter permease [Petroclostridium sp. X23]WHH57630.1 tripartite tricarboxylate transporter permease [Petroclostridium sp. X23]
MFELFVAGFSAVFTFKAMLLITIGVAVGIIFGAIPGLTATMAVALCLPITFGMSPVEGMSLLIGLYIGGVSGGLISAILLKIPGTPSSIATTFDGHPMAAKGQAGKALGTGIVFSFLGGLFSILALIFIAPPLAEFALQFGPFEYFAIAIFSLTMISSLSGNSLAKGLLTGFIGMALATIGTAPIDAYPRFTFGLDELSAGFDLLPVLIGLFAISEILKTAETSLVLKKDEIRDYSIKGFGFTMKEFIEQQWNFVRSSLIGTGVGILPGIGGGTSNIIAYLTAKNQSKYPEKFGTGIIDGIVASETSNNASVGGALIPLLTLGIPGDTVTAMLLGGLMIHGLTPGPLLFQTSGEIVYGIFAALIIANVMMLIMEFFGMRLFVRLLSIPKHILLPVIISLCVVGSFGLNNRVFDVWSLFLFGLLGYVLDKFKYPLPPIILGFILGPIAETNLRRGLMMSNGSFLPFVTKPIAAIFLAIAVFSIVMSVRKNMKNSKEKLQNA